MGHISSSESNEYNNTRKLSRKRGAEHEEKEDGEGIIDLPPTANSTTLTTPLTAHAATDQSMHTPEFKRHFVEFVPVDALMALLVATKGFNAAADVLIDEGVRSRLLMVHDGKDIEQKGWEARKERHKLVTRVIFLLNIKKVGDYACDWAANLVVVDIPEGIESIGERAFSYCYGLTIVSFPTTLTRIDNFAFSWRSSLENVDLLHTNLKKLGEWAFSGCDELKSMTIPDSLQTFGELIFIECQKLVPSYIDASDSGIGSNDATSEVIAHLRSRCEIAALKLQLFEQSTMFQTQITEQSTMFQTKLAEQSTMFQSELTVIKQTLQTLISTLTKNK
ncbi:hypothetical protein TL16_g07762 [Triparma laevis f. inornata]|uniref:Uncharacterized protein n=1 Tax=Triparma laevis f. inornata TaxID=1714386 RepID=A0A9W7EEJ8_9STRA|nr:hypothetical protein TL16_g07762 [Triparma laevis f. inornata]